MQWGKTLAGRIRPKKFEKCLPAGTGTKIYFSRIARFKSQHNERRVYEDWFLCFGRAYDHQRTLVIRIAAITLASDSAITTRDFAHLR